MAPGRTGVKGVIRDRDEAVGLERKKKAREMENIRKRMEAENLGGKTYLQEEREKASRGEAQFDDLILKELEKDLMKRDVFGVPRARFGFLREVGVKQFVKAVEQEETGVWVVVHIYDPVRRRYGTHQFATYSYSLVPTSPLTAVLCLMTYWLI